MLQLQLLPPFSSLSHMLFQRKQTSCQETLTYSTCSPTRCHWQARRRSSQQRRPLVALVGKRETGPGFRSVGTERHIAGLNSGMLTALSSRRHGSVTASPVAAVTRQWTAPILPIRHKFICGIVLKKIKARKKNQLGNSLNACLSRTQFCDLFCKRWPRRNSLPLLFSAYHLQQVRQSKANRCLRTKVTIQHLKTIFKVQLRLMIQSTMGKFPGKSTSWTMSRYPWQIEIFFITG